MIDKQEVLGQVAGTILEKSVRITVDIGQPSWWERVNIKIGRSKAKREFVIRPAVLGTMIRISEMVLKIDPYKGSDGLMDVTARAARDHGYRLAEVVAVAITNRQEAPPASLVKFLLRNMTPEELLGVVQVIVRQLDVGNFLRSITLLRGVSLLNPEEIIASGGQSAAS